MSWLLRVAWAGLFISCSASNASQATLRPSVAPPGWNVFTRTEMSPIGGVGVSKASAAFRIAVPPGWVEASLDDQSVAAGDRALASANPTYAKALEEKLTGKAGQPPLAFSASDTAGSAFEGILTTTVYVTGQHADRVIAAYSMARSMQLYRQQTIGAVLWHSGNAVVDGNDAVRLQMKYELQGSAGERISLATVQYIIVRDKDIFIIEFTGELDQMDSLMPVFESIAATFKIL